MQRAAGRASLWVTHRLLALASWGLKADTCGGTLPSEPQVTLVTPSRAGQAMLSGAALGDQQGKLQNPAGAQCRFLPSQCITQVHQRKLGTAVLLTQNCAREGGRRDCVRNGCVCQTQGLCACCACVSPPACQ